MFRHWNTRCHLLILTAAVFRAAPSSAIILWGDLGATLVHENGVGTDILGGAVKRNDSAGDTLYFKFRIDPLSDVSTEEYFAAFQLYEGDTERLAVGNSQKAWAYSAFNTAGTGKFNQVFGDQDLHSMRPESTKPGEFLPYELPRRGIANVIVFRVQYMPGGDDKVTVWLNPDLSPGATEESQPEGLTTAFSANASFDQIRLRHGGGGPGWTFSEMAIATSFTDLVLGTNPEPGGPAAGPPKGVAPLTFRSWQREQGLPPNSARALAQTREGYLWLGGDDGVARFDGLRFVWYGSREGLRTGPVRVLLADSHDALWIGSSEGGLSRLYKGKFTTFTVQDGLPAASITALAEDPQGRLWVGTSAGLVIWDENHLAPLSAGSALSGHPIACLFKDPKGSVWVGATGAGVFQYQNGDLMRISDRSVDLLLEDPHCFLVDKSERLWLGAGDDIVLCRDGPEWRRYRITRHLTKPYVSVLAEGADGTVWAGSVSEGLFQFQQGKFASFNAANGIPDNLIESLLTDREGNLWVGTGAGLTRIRHSDLLVLGQNEGLGSGSVQGLAEIQPGIVWVARRDDSIYRWEANRFKRLNDPGNPQMFSGINALLTGSDGTCWAGSTNGLFHFAVPDAVAPRGDFILLNDRNVIALANARNGEIWAGTDRGELWRRRGGNWMMETNFHEAHPITCLERRTNNSLWIGTAGGGVYRFDGIVRECIDKHSGLLSESIRALHQSSDGVLWIGTAAGGLSCWNNGRLVTLTTREGLPDNTISQILEDDLDRLWLGSNRGISRVNRGEVLALAAGNISVIHPRTYGRAEGLPSEECMGGFCPEGLRTKSGQLWFSTANGIVVADGQSASTPALSPVVVLEQVTVDGVEVALPDGRPIIASDRLPNWRPRPNRRGGSHSATITIPPGKHRVEFHYTALSFSAPEQLRYRYRLESLDRDWFEAGTQRVAPYGYVPPGEFRFEVIACDPDGNWNSAGAAIELSVLPHFWQSGWFITLTSLVLGGSVGAGVWLIEKRRAQRRFKLLEQERAVERERARIAQDLHDDLGSSLARISLLSSLALADKSNPEQVEVHIDKIARSADDTVRALEEIVWAVRPGYDSLQSLVEYIAHFATELFEGNGTRCRLDLPHDLPPRSLPPEMRHNIFLVVKEALTNALKHASAHEVRVQAKASPLSLELIVQDDGRGFNSRTDTGPNNRHGLQNMRQRAVDMAGQLHIDSIPGQGTIVRLIVTFPKASDSRPTVS